MTTSRRALVALPLAAATTALRAQESAWPSRPIRLIVSYAPGGAADITARLIAPRMAERLEAIYREVA